MSRARNAWAINRPEVALHWFAKPGGQSDNFDMFPELDRIRCPTLVIGGEDDPMHPIERQIDPRCHVAAAPRPVRTLRCGHGVVPDAPERAMALLRKFILRR
jgi:pimeloyl-ACP methyl ester carboxylesterase